MCIERVGGSEGGERKEGVRGKGRKGVREGGRGWTINRGEKRGIWWKGGRGEG